MIHDPSDEELYKLKVDISTGVATNTDDTDDLPSSTVIDDPLVPEETRNLPIVPKDRQSALPKSGFRMKVQPILDLSWREQFGNLAQTRLNAVLEHAKTFFQHSTLETRYELEVLPVHNYPTRMTASSDIQ